MKQKFYNNKTKELNDKEILNALEEAYKDYENGAISECRLTLNQISRAIFEFEQDADEALKITE